MTVQIKKVRPFRGRKGSADLARKENGEENGRTGDAGKERGRRRKRARCIVPLPGRLALACAGSGGSAREGLDTPREGVCEPLVKMGTEGEEITARRRSKLRWCGRIGWWRKACRWWFAKE